MAPETRVRGRDPSPSREGSLVMGWGGGGERGQGCEGEGPRASVRGGMAGSLRRSREGGNLASLRHSREGGRSFPGGGNLAALPPCRHARGRPTRLYRGTGNPQNIWMRGSRLRGNDDAAPPLCPRRAAHTRGILQSQWMRGSRLRGNDDAAPPLRPRAALPICGEPSKAIGCEVPAYAGTTWVREGGSADAAVEVSPGGVLLLDQAHFPSPIPLLDRLLPTDGALHGFVLFVPHERGDVVSMRMAFCHTGFVLPDAPGKVRGNAEVERSAGSAREQVDTREAGLAAIGAHERNLPRRYSTSASHGCRPSLPCVGGGPSSFPRRREPRSPVAPSSGARYALIRGNGGLHTWMRGSRLRGNGGAPTPLRLAPCR